MFSNIVNTKFRPDKPMLIWDRDCSFCKYWVLKWKAITKDDVAYVPYQEISDEIYDIPQSDFKEAERLIEPGGRVFNGPEAAFRVLSYSSKKHGKWHRRYKSSEGFKYICDKLYVFIASNRNLTFKITRVIWGKTPV